MWRYVSICARRSSSSKRLLNLSRLRNFQDCASLSIARTSKRSNRSLGSCHPFSTTNNSGNETIDPQNNNSNDDDDEDWIPPIPNQDASKTPQNRDERIETSLEFSRQVKEQERLDKALEDTQNEADALLFQLTEEEQETLSEEEILERLDAILEKEEELEDQLVMKELEREEEERQRTEEKRKEAVEAAAALDPQALEETADTLAAQTPDWLSTRRAVLGGSNDDASSDIVPIIPHTLLTSVEIDALLKHYGGRDIVVIHDDPEAPRMGGADGMIICTGSGGSNANSLIYDTSPHLIATLSTVLIDHLKDRQLFDVAPSANQNTTHRATASAPARVIGSESGRGSDSWRIVDCGNYIVHILDASTRWDLNLEDLWSGKDPIWNLDFLDEDAVDEYCYQHAVPSGNDVLLGDDVDLRKLEKIRYEKHKPVVSQATKNRDRRNTRRKKREEKQQKYDSFGYD